MYLNNKIDTAYAVATCLEALESFDLLLVKLSL